MKTAEQIVSEFESNKISNGCGRCPDFCDRSRAALITAIDEALALVRADERVKATADALVQVTRNLGPRSGAQ